MLFMPYLMAVTTEVINEILHNRKMNEGEIVVPVSVDCRSNNKRNDMVFFNHLSFMFYKIKRHIVSNRYELIASIKKQMYKQVKDKLPESLAKVSYLMRIIPLRLFEQIFKLPFVGWKNTYSFASILSSSYKSQSFLGLPIRNILHFPTVPLDPGVGIFFTRYNKKLNLVLSYFEDSLSEDEVDKIIELMQRKLNE